VNHKLDFTSQEKDEKGVEAILFYPAEGRRYKKRDHDSSALAKEGPRIKAYKGEVDLCSA